MIGVFKRSGCFAGVMPLAVLQKGQGSGGSEELQENGPAGGLLGSAGESNTLGVDSPIHY